MTATRETEKPACTADWLGFYQDRVEVLVRPSTVPRAVLRFRHCLEDSGVVRILSITAHKPDTVQFAAELLMPLLFPAFLQSLPGVLEVKGTEQDQTRQVYVILDHTAHLEARQALGRAGRSGASPSFSSGLAHLVPLRLDKRVPPRHDGSGVELGSARL